MKVDCSQIEPWVQQYLDRELGEPEQQELLRHLEGCRACQAAYGPLLEVIRDVEQAAAPQVPAGLLEQVLEELPAMQVGPATAGPTIRRHPSRLMVWLSGVAAAAAVVLVTFSRMQTGVVSLTDRGDMAARDADPRTVMWLVSAACTAPVGNIQPNLGLVAGQMAAWQSQQASGEPMRVTLCMAMPPASADRPDSEPMSDVLQIISNRAALRGGL